VLVVHAEIAHAHELEAVARLCFSKGCLQLTVAQHGQRIGIQTVQIVFVFRNIIDIFQTEQIIIQHDLCINGGRRTYPVDRAPYLAPVKISLQS